MNIAHPERRITRGLPFNSNDGVVVSVNPNLAVDQILVRCSWRSLEHVRWPSFERFLTNNLEVVVIGSETSAVACPSVGRFALFAQQLLKHVLANRARALFRKDCELLGTVACALDTHEHLGAALLVHGNIPPSRRVSSELRLSLGVKLHHLRDNSVCRRKWGPCLSRRKGHRDEKRQTGKGVLDGQLHNQNSNTNL